MRQALAAAVPPPRKTYPPRRRPAIEPYVTVIDGWLIEDERIRGLGVADLVDSIGGRPQRASAELGHHVLEVLESIQISNTSDAVVHLKTAPNRPAPVLAGDLAGLSVPPAGG